MRKVLLALAVSTAPLLLAVPASAQAGLTFGLNGGVAMPMGDAGDVLKTGFGGGATLSMRNPAGRVGFGIDAQFYRFSYNDDLPVLSDARQNMYGVFARVDYSANNSLYILGGGGLMRSEITSDDDGPDLGETNNTDFAIEAGLGVNFARGIYAEAKFLNIFGDGNNTQLVPITVGIRF